MPKIIQQIEGPTRMFKDEILENERRRKIYVAVEANPGFHLRRLQKALNMPLTTLHYHLSYMTRKKIVFAEPEGHQKKYYTKRLEAEDKRILSALRQKKTRDIILAVLANRKTKYQLLANRLKLPRSTLSYHLKQLVDKSILTQEKIGHENVYILSDQNRVEKVLAAYKSSFTEKSAKTHA
jgi:predicted transcriptional regulator